MLISGASGVLAPASSTVRRCAFAARKSYGAAARILRRIGRRAGAEMNVHALENHHHLRTALGGEPDSAREVAAFLGTDGVVALSTRAGRGDVDFDPHEPTMTRALGRCRQSARAQLSSWRRRRAAKPVARSRNRSEWLMRIDRCSLVEGRIGHCESMRPATRCGLLLARGELICKKAASAGSLDGV